MPAAILRRFTDRVALITGAARGQGAAHAERLASEGCRVYMCDILDEVGEHVAGVLRGGDLDVTYLTLDVASMQAWSAAHDLIQARDGRLDILVNNAGIVHAKTVEEEDPEEWSRTLAVNLTGAFLGIKTMIPLLRRSGAASVINVASIYGPAGAAEHAAYAASKAGLIGLTRAVALELAPSGIRVNALIPGSISTPMNAGKDSGPMLRDTPLGRRGTVQEAAGAVAFLASDDAGFVTGTELVVDGGYLTR